MDTTSLAHYNATHFLWECSDRVATITLNRPDRKNPLTFESYAELRDLFEGCLRRGYRCRGYHGCRWQFLLRRRCPRDHRSFDK